MTNASASSAAGLDEGRHRLQRLLGYLEQDPGNDLLRQDAIATACDVAEPETARRLLADRQSRGELPPLPWGFLSARIALAEQDWEEALRRWDALIASPQVDEDARLQAAAPAAQLRVRLGRTDEAVSLLAPLVAAVAPNATMPESTQAAWVRVQHHAGHLAEVMDWVRARDAAGQLGADAAGAASLVAMDVNDLDGCMRLARSALARDAEQGEALVCAAAISLVEGDAAQSLALNERVVALRPSDGRAWTQLGAARLLVSDLQGARVAYARATELMPGHAGSWHGLAWTQVLLGDLVEAERLLTHALEIDRNFAETHGALAVVYARTGRRSMAQEAMRRAQGLDPRGFAAQYAAALLDQPDLSPEALTALATRLLDGQRLPDGRRASSLLGAAARR